jgi:hypothetical protein
MRLFFLGSNQSKMKRIFITVLVLFNTASFCKAQTFVAATLNTWTHSKFDEQTGDTLDAYRYKGTTAMPSIGLFKVYRNGIGAGLEIGFFRQHANVEFSGSNSGVLYDDQITIGQSGVYLCPSVFELFKHKAYIITLSAALPMLYVFDRKRVDQYIDRDKASDEVLSSFYREYLIPNVFQVSIAGRCLLQRKIYKGLYLGIQGSVMFTSEFLYGTAVDHRVGTSNGVTDEGTWETQMKDHDSYIDFVPAFVVSYQL